MSWATISRPLWNLTPCLSLTVSVWSVSTQESASCGLRGLRIGTEVVDQPIEDLLGDEAERDDLEVRVELDVAGTGGHQVARCAAARPASGASGAALAVAELATPSTPRAPATTSPPLEHLPTSDQRAV